MSVSQHTRTHTHTHAHLVIANCRSQPSSGCRGNVMAVLVHVYMCIVLLTLTTATYLIVRWLNVTF